MIGLATITLSTSSVRAEETTDQSSYPLKSANAMPDGDFSEYLSSLSCAQTATAARVAILLVIPIVSLLVRFMLILPVDTVRSRSKSHRSHAGDCTLVSVR